MTATQTPRPGRVAAVRASLRVVYPEGLEQTIAVESTVLIVGRQKGNGAHALAHPTVSRHHVRIEWSRAAGAHVVFDLGSHNGSRLNGRQLAPDSGCELAPGDAIQLGDVIAIYEMAPAEPSDDGPISRDALPGDSMAMQRLRRKVARAARDPSPVLLVGETGTGKEHIARELHRLSGRAGQMVTWNCAALGRELADVGQLRAAAGGTLFLDDIGELSPELQAEVLRLLRGAEPLSAGNGGGQGMDVRVIAATSRDLASRVEAGGFRRDLYARLAQWEIAVPPLRERRADVLDWVDRLHRRLPAQRPDQQPAPPIELSPAAAEQILLADWPENLRGIARLVHDLATRLGGGRVEADSLPDWLSRQPPELDRAAPRLAQANAPRRGRRPTPSPDELSAALREHDGSVRAVARRFGRDRRQIYRWLEAFGLGEQRRGMR